MGTDEELRNHMLFNTRQYFTACSNHSLLQGILTEVEQMLPQIKLIQALDRVFPEHCGQHKYSSSKKKKKKRLRAIFWPRSSPAGRRWPRKRACAYRFPTFPSQRSSALSGSRHQAPWSAGMTAACQAPHFTGHKTKAREAALGIHRAREVAWLCEFPAHMPLYCDNTAVRS